MGKVDESIIARLNLPYWKEKKYQQLLVPSIFSISISNIENGIKLLKEYGIDQYVTNKCLRLKTSLLKKLIEYIIQNNLSLVTFNSKTHLYGLNPILSCERGKLKNRFNIDPDQLEGDGKAK